MADLIGTAKGYLPSWSLAGVGTFFFWFAVFILFVIIVGGLTAWWVYSYIQKKKFNKNIVKWQDVDGRPTIVGKDVACESKIGSGGDTVFFIKNAKKTVPRPNKQTGINTYWYYIRADGEWINIGMEDIDANMREAKVSWNDNELKYARASLQSINRDRYEEKPSWWKQYGTMVMNIIYVVVFSIAFVFIASKLAVLVGTINSGQVGQNELLDRVNKLLATVDNVCSKSGVVSA
jgi:small-conductance mechanosensitive channel